MGTPNNRPYKTFLVGNLYTFYLRKCFAVLFKFSSICVFLFFSQFYEAPTLFWGPDCVRYGLFVLSFDYFFPVDVLIKGSSPNFSSVNFPLKTNCLNYKGIPVNSLHSAHYFINKFASVRLSAFRSFQIRFTFASKFFQICFNSFSHLLQIRFKFVSTMFEVCFRTWSSSLQVLRKQSIF